MIWSVGEFKLRAFQLTAAKELFSFLRLARNKPLFRESMTDKTLKRRLGVFEKQSEQSVGAVHVHLLSRILLQTKKRRALLRKRVCV